MKTRFREFDRDDHETFEGAEEFDDGVGPYIAETDNYLIVLDRTGIEIFSGADFESAAKLVLTDEEEQSSNDLLDSFVDAGFIR